MTTKISYAQLLTLLRLAGRTVRWMSDTVVVFDRFPIVYRAQIHASYVELHSTNAIA